MFEAAITAPCLATLRINRRSKTNTRLESWKLRATAVDLSGTLNQTVGGQLMMQHINNNYTKLGRSETLLKKKKKKRRRRVFFLDDNPLSCNGSTPTLQSFADPVVAILGRKLAIGTPLISTKSEDIPRSLLIAEEITNAKRPLSLLGLSCGSISCLTSAQVVQASENVKMNVVYEVGELFELGIQLSYLLILLGLLGVGTFFVIRQVLVRRELDLSAKELQEQVRSGDASATEFFELGAVMLRRKFYPAAIKYLLQAIEKWDGDDQDLAQVYNALGVSYVRDGKLDKGIAQFETAVKLQPGYVTAWNNLGDAYEQKKEMNSALKAFEEVLLFDPNNRLARPRRDALKDKVQMYKGVSVKSKER